MAVPRKQLNHRQFSLATAMLTVMVVAIALVIPLWLIWPAIVYAFFITVGCYLDRQQQAAEVAGLAVITLVCRGLSSPAFISTMLP